MAFAPFQEDLNIIVKLDDEPNDVSGLSAAQLKAEFDRAGLAIQNYINHSLLPELESKLAAAGIGCVSVDGLENETNVQEVFRWIRRTMDELQVGVVGDGSITAEKLSAGAVTGDKIREQAVGYGCLDAALQQQLNKVRTITVSAAQPTGGNDGDIWLVVS